MIETITIDQYEKYRKDPAGPHGLFIESNSTHLIVYFGSYAGEFRGHQTIISTGSNGLLVRSNYATWYLDENYSLGSTPQQVVDYLTTFVDQQTHIKTITLAGFSMGGFASLLYGTWMRCNKIVANVPQTRAPTWKQKDGYIPNYPSRLKQYIHIKEVWETYSPPICNVEIRCCERYSSSDTFKDIDDANELRKFPCVKIITYPCVGHMAVSKHLLQDNYNQTFLVE